MGVWRGRQQHPVILLEGMCLASLSLLLQKTTPPLNHPKKGKIVGIFLMTDSEPVNKHWGLLSFFLHLPLCLPPPRPPPPIVHICCAQDLLLVVLGDCIWRQESNLGQLHAKQALTLCTISGPSCMLLCLSFLFFGGGGESH